MLNNQPMGFYSPAMLIKDAQRHGLRVLPVDVTSRSGIARWKMGLLPRRQKEAARRRQPGSRQEEARSYPSSSRPPLRPRSPRGSRPRHPARAPLHQHRRPGAARPRAAQGRNQPPGRNRRAELLDRIHRRDALWQAQRATLPVGPLLAPLEETGEPSPLAPMDTEERLWADYRGTGLTIGKHPMAYRRAEMDALGVTRAADLAQPPQRPPGTHRRIGHRAAAPRHGQGFRLYEHGR